MKRSPPPLTRRHFLRGVGLAAGNARDNIYRHIGDAKAQEAVTVDFSPVKDSGIGELAAKFDFVLGFAPGVS